MRTTPRLRAYLRRFRPKAPAAPQTPLPDHPDHRGFTANRSFEELVRRDRPGQAPRSGQ